MLGAAMSLVIGKGDIIVITVGIVIVFAGIYALSLVNPATAQFMGVGWPETICRISAFIAGLLMMASGFISSTGGIRDMLIFHNLAGLNLAIIGLLPLGWGLYIIKLAKNGVQS